MTSTSLDKGINRRALLAAGVVSIPSLAIAGSASQVMEVNTGMEFHKLMGQAGDHLKSMRGHMRDLDAPGSRDDAAFLSNQVTILLAQCVMVAEQESIPVQSEAKYDGDKARFTMDMQIKLTAAVSAANSLTRQLLMGNDEEAVSLYGSLRRERKEGHDEFISEDD